MSDDEDETDSESDDSDNNDDDDEETPPRLSRYPVKSSRGQPIDRLTYSKLGGVAKVSRKLMSALRAEAFLHGLPNVLDKQRTKHEYWVYDSVREDLEQDGLLNGMHPFSLAAKVNSADTLTFHEAMIGVDRAKFLKAMDAEIEGLDHKDAWTATDKTDEMNILDSTWTYKVKRFSDGTVRKYKARLCTRGYQQI